MAATFTPIEAVTHPNGRFSPLGVASLVGARLTVDGDLEYAVRSLEVGGARDLAAGPRALHRLVRGDSPHETSRFRLDEYLCGHPLSVDIAEALAAGADPTRRPVVFSKVKAAAERDWLINTFVFEEAKVYGEVRVGTNWKRATPGRHRPPYTVLPHETTAQDAAGALADLLLADDDVVSIDRRSTIPGRVVPQQVRGGMLIESWTLQVGSHGYPSCPLLKISGAEVWAYNDGEVGLRLRHVDGLTVEKN